MSNCIIKIKIGDQEITLDPNSNISASDSSTIAGTLDVAKIRNLFSSVKDLTDFSTPEHEMFDITRGRSIYNALSAEAVKDGVFLTPSLALSRGAELIEEVKSQYKDAVATELDPNLQLLLDASDPLLSLRAFVQSRDYTETLESGNFVASPAEAYKQSPQTIAHIHNVFFKNSSGRRALFQHLTSMPGMETLKIGIAIVNDSDNVKSSVKGTYITPDNIIQITIPNDYRYVAESTKGDIAQYALKSKAINEASRIILHELAHSVFTELYKADSSFRSNMKEIHSKVMDSLDDESLKIRDRVKDRIKNRYSDLQEFITDLFTETELINVMNKIPSISLEGNKNETLYDYFVKTFNLGETVDDSLLADAIKSYSTSSLFDSIVETREQVDKDYMENDEFRYRFFSGDSFNEEEVDDHITPRTKYDTFGSVNAKAFYIQKWFADNIKEGGVFTKDIYFKAAETPNDYKLDKLFSKDIVNIPWVRYVKDGTGGRWQEQGVVVDSKGKGIISNGKLKVVDIIRGENGEIIQDIKKNGGTIEERLTSAPVVYSNSNKKTVVVAKVNDNLTRNTINTVSIPYNMIRGIRKYDRNYFDHTENFDSQIKEQRDRISALTVGKDTLNYETRTAVAEIEKNIEELQKKSETAKQIIERNKDLYRKYNFSVEDEVDSNTRLINTTETDYVAAGYRLDDKTRVFARDENEAAYRIFKNRAGKNIVMPNPKRFKLMYDGGKEFLQGLRDSADYKTAISEGDLVQFAIKDENGETWKWAPITRAIANGVEVATKEGKGMFVPFNRVKALAKNVHSEWFLSEIGVNLFNQTKQLKNLIYATKGSAERQLANEVIKYKGFAYNEKYHKKADENDQDALQRFSDNRQRIIEDALPYKSYVQVTRRFDTWDRTGRKPSKVQNEYISTEMILAKNDEGFLTLRYSLEGNPTIELVPFDAQDTSEILFVIDSIQDVKELWDEFMEEKKTLQDNYQNFLRGVEDAKKEYITNKGTPEAPKMKFTYDRRLNPTSFKDTYDFYDDVKNHLDKLVKGDIIALNAKTKSEATKEGSKRLPYFRKVLSVRNDGYVVVAEYRDKDVSLDNGFTLKKGYYPRAIKPDDIVSVGLKAFTIKSDSPDNRLTEGESYALAYREDLIKRRQFMLESAQRDLDFDDFVFRTRSTALKFNAAVDKYASDSKPYLYYIPFTSKLLDKNLPDTYLNKKLEVTPEDEVWVQAWVNKGVTNVIRGINANTNYFKKALIVDDRSSKLKPEIYNELRTGDWITIEYKDKSGVTRQFNKLIERLVNGEVYALNSDLSTFKVNFSSNKIIGVRTSVRNDKWSQFKRTDKLRALVKGVNVPKQSKNSLDISYKSPASSYRALNEITSRFQQMNPEINVKFVNGNDINDLFKRTGFNYGNSRAFILNGEVSINTDKASVSDVIHEYAHLFLHSLKYDDYDLYRAMINMTNSSPMYTKVSDTYSHLIGDDLDEEVFVTVLGEYLRGTLENTEWADSKEPAFLEFANYTKNKLGTVLNKNIADLRDVEAEDVMYMKLEDVIVMIGDWVMNNRLTDLYADYNYEKSNNITKLKKDLMDRGYLTKQCYG